MPRQQIYADLPADLDEADEVLRRYGRWARGSQGGPESCGSAERAYRSPQNDEDRQPSSPSMLPAEVSRTRQALGELPMMTLCVIQWLYVNPGTVHRRMRAAGLQPHHMRERHLEGVREFWRCWQLLGRATAPLEIASALV